MKHSYSRAKVISNNGDRALLECADDEFVSITRGVVGSGFENLFADEFLALLPVGRAFPIRLNFEGKRETVSLPLREYLEKKAQVPAQAQAFAAA
jgi:hypothetical protein